MDFLKMINWLKNIFTNNTDEMDMNSKIGQRVVLKGVANNGKAGALITVKDLPIYIEGLERWDESLRGKKVTIVGILRQDAIFPQADAFSDFPMQGMSGAAFYIEDYRLL